MRNVITFVGMRGSGGNVTRSSSEIPEEKYKNLN
jgi:hypothetical protein